MQKYKIKKYKTDFMFLNIVYNIKGSREKELL